MPDLELQEVLGRLADQVEPSPELLDDIRDAIRRAERRRRLRVAVVVIGLLAAMVGGLLFLTHGRSDGAPPSGLADGAAPWPATDDVPPSDEAAEYADPVCAAAFGVLRGLEVSQSTTAEDIGGWVAEQRALVEGLVSEAPDDIAAAASTFGRHYGVALDHLEQSGFDPALAGRLGEELASDPAAFGLTPAEYSEAEAAYDAIARVWAFTHCTRAPEGTAP